MYVIGHCNIKPSTKILQAVCFIAIVELVFVSKYHQCSPHAEFVSRHHQCSFHAEFDEMQASCNHLPIFFWELIDLKHYHIIDQLEFDQWVNCLLIKVIVLFSRSKSNPLPSIFFKSADANLYFPMSMVQKNPFIHRYYHYQVFVQFPMMSLIQTESLCSDWLLDWFSSIKCLIIYSF